jgi:RNA polymerase sigma-70 factor (ECF subfamily)
MTDIETYYRNSRQKLFGYLLRLSASYDLAADQMQETFLRYVEHYGRDDVKSSLLYRIARNMAFDSMRKNRRMSPLTDDMIDDRMPPDQNLSARAEFQDMLQAMQQLKTDEREILALVSGDDHLTYQDIGKIMGISEGNVKVKIHRARVKLRELVKR